ncbi:hypothetical protein NLI96_g5279 [Meripilus lineatus]|uniref:F-box domain-containing protein n=1 Tax=Meripilus lineatus TaxID=2056292 RepID=A0AAD5V3B5_9APHY|nr:hypothetical protein NLI96_g5279 [Physisporinus lineatus]
MIPEEVLADILLLYIDLAVRDPVFTVSAQYFDKTPRRLYRWIQVTQVCRYWRGISLSYPRMWGHIIINRPEMAEECLKRSGCSPLYIWRFGRSRLSEKEDRVIQLALGHLSRIQDIRFSTADRDFSSTWFPREGSEPLSAASLTSLNLDTSGYCTGLLEYLSDLKPPRLRHLELYGCDNHTWLLTPIPPSLRFFKVTITQTRVHRGIETIDTPDQYRYLESLHIITNSMSFIFPPANNFQPQPRFSSLKYLFIHCYLVEDIYRGIQLLKFPPDAQVRVSAGHGVPSLGRLSELCGWSTCRSLAIKAWPERDTFSVCGWTERLTTARIQHGQISPLCAFTCRITQSDTTRFLFTLEQVLPKVQTMVFAQCGEGKDPGRLFAKVASLLPEVSQIGFIGKVECLDDVLQVMSRHATCLVIQPAQWSPEISDTIIRFLDLERSYEEGVRLSRLEIPDTAHKESITALQTLAGEVVAVRPIPLQMQEKRDVFYDGATPLL